MQIDSRLKEIDFRFQVYRRHRQYRKIAARKKFQ